jgi:hypothetical protein
MSLLPEPITTRKGQYRHHIIWQETQALGLNDDEVVSLIKSKYYLTEVHCGKYGGVKKFYWT